ncbi:hypothetical protein Ae201684P_015977 [Aphanomyces euteiches]|uniref:Uncharacterized protein n=1 Tax=Aphanomyces euteiches TaxID=100861 RepID=A0A6G0W4C7_9STRA|nr:hypothetical protein Ae201684_018882 [Aphanomyces euteiches]KAH9074079.1 hypothetical protein Ae201684P_015977 [Aphanomyces euteiches]
MGSVNVSVVIGETFTDGGKLCMDERDRFFEVLCVCTKVGIELPDFPGDFVDDPDNLKPRDATTNDLHVVFRENALAPPAACSHLA